MAVAEVAPWRGCMSRWSACYWQRRATTRGGEVAWPVAVPVWVSVEPGALLCMLRVATLVKLGMLVVVVVQVGVGVRNGVAAAVVASMVGVQGQAAVTAVAPAAAAEVVAVAV